MNWLCTLCTTDGKCEVKIEGDTAQEVAQKYVDCGWLWFWGESARPKHIDVYCKLASRWMVIELDTGDCVERFDSQARARRYANDCDAEALRRGLAETECYDVVEDDSHDETITIELEPGVR